MILSRVGPEDGGLKVVSSIFSGVNLGNVDEWNFMVSGFLKKMSVIEKIQKWYEMFFEDFIGTCSLEFVPLLCFDGF